VEQVTRDLDVLRARKEARLRHPLWSLPSRLSRARRSLERHPLGAFFTAHVRWPLVIIPVLASWAVQEVGSDWTTKGRPFFDYCITLGTLCLIAIVLHARYLERRGKADSTQAGMSAGAALVALAPAVMSLMILLLIALGLPLGLLQEIAALSLRHPEVLVIATVYGLAAWTPIGVLITCRADAKRSLRKLRASLLGWRHRMEFAFGLLLAIPATVPTMLPHLRLLGFFVYGSD
jgi:hypothetical protein